MTAKKKNTSTRRNKRERAAELKRIRLAITESYHDLSRVDCDDRISGKSIPNGPVSEISLAVDHLGGAINRLNRALGRKEKSEPTVEEVIAS